MLDRFNNEGVFQTFATSYALCRIYVEHRVEKIAELHNTLVRFTVQFLIANQVCDQLTSRLQQCQNRDFVLNFKNIIINLLLKVYQICDFVDLVIQEIQVLIEVLILEE